MIELVGGKLVDKWYDSLEKVEEECYNKKSVLVNVMYDNFVCYGNCEIVYSKIDGKELYF